MDKLEKFIRENRQDLDRYEPDQAIWNRIEKINGRKVMFIPGYLMRAAMIVLIAASSLLIYKITSGGNYRNGKNIVSDSRFSPELTEAEIYYTSMANNLLEKAKPYMASNPVLESELMSEIAHLDSISGNIRKDLKDNISNQEVIEALIMNYRIKVRLLEEMLEILTEQEENNKDNTPKHEL